VKDTFILLAAFSVSVLIEVNIHFFANQLLFLNNVCSSAYQYNRCAVYLLPTII
jgi:hypothetical protein